MLKKAAITIAILIFITGCVGTGITHKPKSRSTAQQHERAGAAFDELEDKPPEPPKKTATAAPKAIPAPKETRDAPPPAPEPMDFSAPRYLTAKGFGMSKPEAIRQGKAELSNIFESRIQSDVSSRVKAVVDSVRGDSLSKTLRSTVRVASDVELQGVEIGKIWKEGSEYTAIVALDKKKAAEKWMADLDKTDTEISVHTESATRAKGRFSKLNHLKEAMKLWVEREATLSRLRVIGYSDTRSGAIDLKPLLQKISALKSSMRINLNVQGHYGLDVRDTVATILTGQGFNISDTSYRADVLITGKVETSRVNTKNKHFKFSRARVSLNIIDTVSGSQVGQISENERGAHLNYEEASRVAVKKVSRKVSEKLIKYFD